MCNDLDRITAGHRETDQSTVRSTVVRDDPKVIVAMIRGVLHPFGPWKDQRRLGLRFGRWNAPNVAGDRRLCADEDEPATARSPHGEVVALVVFLMDQGVGGRVGSEAMSPDLPRAHRGVGHRVEVVQRIGCPGRAV